MQPLHPGVGVSAGRREWASLAVMALPCLLYAMDGTVLNLAVPSLSAALTPSSTELLWIVDIYGFFTASALVTMGTLGDRIGRRRLLLIGATAFGLASVLAAFATSARMLIAARAVLGMAGATLAPSTLSLIRNIFLDPRERSLAIGLWTASFSLGAAIGPALGGLLLQQFWWGSVFLVSVPIMGALLVLGPWLLPEYRDPGAGRMDFLSAALSLIGILALVYGLKQAAVEGVGLLPGLWVLTGIAACVLFGWRQRRLTEPLIDLGLFRAPAFSAALAANALSLFTAFGSFLFTAQYLQAVLGLSPLAAGLWTVPSSGGFIVGSLLAPLIGRRVRYQTVVLGGLGLAAIGFGVLTQVHDAAGLALVMTGSVTLAVGIAAVVTASTDIIVGAAPPERAGAASAISETGAELGGALGIAILGSIGTAVYRRAVASALPFGLSVTASEAVRQTVSGALAEARRLPDPLGAAVADVARAAFIDAFRTTAAVSAMIALAIAVSAVALLRRDRQVAPGSEAGVNRG